MAFTEVILNVKNNEQNNIRMFLYMIQIKAVCVTVISAASYHRSLSSTHFESHMA